MNILALDTSGPVAGVAILREGSVVHLTAMKYGHTHSQTVLPAVDRALEECGLTCREIDVFAAVAGPGSFTGVRIGVCMAKGLAHAAGKPCCAVNALETLSMNCLGFDGWVCPILDARRDQVYAAAFDTRDFVPRRVLADQAVKIEDFLAQLPDGRLAFVGDGVPVQEKTLLRLLGERAAIMPANARDLRADAAGMLAAAHPERWEDPRTLRPIYLRAPQAERERMERMARK
ncbi:MAG TPA: tRNA (adenosine(37)-N6)-threonylcarbamoyltransferase complex dimerization subunit type 1 TsaB [Candidatus Pullichristensenella excrementigallinarum]|uniref:tRNA (Adenosine(37)-N6)-threonylcarbamoyltransferase complex dimerization subunit type 1 TsaB n=1 Tax=Candidatus Pullichristensenella excrementigallinarum TaxID=2840907 RepID=A0A9D1I9V3_9FIRM|nr:tRNA (adenosine(37)-N6)-threonylcarbamoyltransferase complex dimerization subunit type 1 TsaB [Candidatus Pullichristensenella excrementigallinarum]